MKTGAVFVGDIVQKRERLRRRGKFCAEPIRLKLREPGQIAATNSGRETKKVFDQRGGTSLAARSVTFQNDRAQSLGGGVNCRGKTGRTRTDDCQVRHDFVFILERERTKQTSHLRDFAQ